MKNYIFLVWFMCFSCHQVSGNRRTELWSMIKSNNKDSIISAVIEIQKAKDTAMIEALLYEPYDARVTNQLNYKGMSVYQIKMLALASMTSQKPPQRITYMPDSAVVNFYIDVTSKK